VRQRNAPREGEIRERFREYAARARVRIRAVVRRVRGAAAVIRELRGALRQGSAVPAMRR